MDLSKIKSIMSEALDEGFLTKKERQSLLDDGYPENEVDQIEQAAGKRVTTYEVDDKPITRDEAIEILGRAGYLSGLERSAFHRTASRSANGKTVIFDSAKLFKDVKPED